MPSDESVREVRQELPIVTMTTGEAVDFRQSPLFEKNNMRAARREPGDVRKVTETA